jgi:hypothetical protein
MYSEINTNEISVFESLNLIPFNDNGISAGIIIGFIPLVQNDYVSSLRGMELTDYNILFGLGVGIGNLNEAISKIWEKPKDT